MQITEQTIEKTIDYIMNVCKCQQRFLNNNDMYLSAKNRFNISKEEFINIYDDIKQIITECKNAENKEWEGFKI